MRTFSRKLISAVAIAIACIACCAAASADVAYWGLTKVPGAALTGSNFDFESVVTLTRHGQPPISARVSAVNSAGATQCTVALNLSAATSGDVWQLAVKNPDGSTSQPFDFTIP